MGAGLYIIREARQLYFPVVNRTWRVGLRMGQINRAIESVKGSRVPEGDETSRLLAEQEKCKKEIAALVTLIDDDAPYYFRDAYNCLSVLWSLNLRWLGDVAPLLDRGGRLQIPTLLRFRRMVLTAEQHFPAKPDLERTGWLVDNQDDSLESYHDVLVSKRENLVNFLNRAISKGSAVYCSL